MTTCRSSSIKRLCFYLQMVLRSQHLNHKQFYLQSAESREARPTLDFASERNKSPVPNGHFLRNRPGRKTKLVCSRRGYQDTLHETAKCNESYLEALGVQARPICYKSTEPPSAPSLTVAVTWGANRSQTHTTSFNIKL